MTEHVHTDVPDIKSQLRNLEYRSMVRELARVMGYHHLMTEAAGAWREHLREQGQPDTTPSLGPPAAFLVTCEHLGGQRNACHWCGGSGRITQRVSLAMEEAKARGTLALSIRQPWAHAVQHLGKTIENRQWYCEYRGPVLLHASRMVGARGLVPASFLEDVETVRAIASRAGIAWDDGEPITVRELTARSGGIFARARIADCVRQSDNPWFTGPWGIVLEDIEPLPFIRCRGDLGLWKVPADVARVAGAL